MKLHGEHYIPNVCRNLVVDMEFPNPVFEDSEGPGVDLHLGQGRELKFQCTDVCCPEEYPVARQGNSVITFDGSEYIGDVVRRFIEYKASKEGDQYAKARVAIDQMLYGENFAR